MEKKSNWKAALLLSAALVWTGAEPVRAATMTAAPTLLAEAPLAIASTGGGGVAPMSDAAKAGMGCLLTSSAAMGGIYALGPTEIMMLVTGAVIVPTTSSLLFLALAGISAGATCGMGAMATPAVLWAAEHADNYATRLTNWADDTLGFTRAQEDVGDVRPMTDAEVQSTGCLVGAGSAGGVAMYGEASEILALAVGGVGVPSTTGILLLGLLSTVIPAGCGVGGIVTPAVVAAWNGLGDVGTNLSQHGSRFGHFLAETGNRLSNSVLSLTGSGSGTLAVQERADMTVGGVTYTVGALPMQMAEETGAAR